MEKKVEKVKRQSGIELLRILAICGVVVLHYNNRDIGGALKYVSEGTLNYYLLNILESLFICGVNLFILISGYFLCVSQKRKVIRIFELIIQVSIFGMIKSLIQGMSLKGIIISAIPNNYFVILYIVLYLISPYINLLLANLKGEKLNRFFILSIMLFSVWPTAVDVFEEITTREWMGLSSIGMYGSQAGYTVVNFVLLYLIGAYIHLSDFQFSRLGKGKLIICVIGCSILLTIWTIVLPKTALEYCNPIIIIEAVCLFLVFKEMNFYNCFVNSLAKATFTCFLLHDIFLPYLNIERAVKSNILFLSIHILGSIIGIYLLSWAAYLGYEYLTNYFFAKINLYTSKWDKNISLHN